MADRLEVSGGDFFDKVPSAGLYLLKFILHDWDDESCVKILRNCRAAMRPGGRVAVVEMVLRADADKSAAAPLMDVNMLAMTVGRERDVPAFDGLFTKRTQARSGYKGSTSLPSH